MSEQISRTDRKKLLDDAFREKPQTELDYAKIREAGRIILCSKEDVSDSEWNAIPVRLRRLAIAALCFAATRLIEFK